MRKCYGGIDLGGTFIKAGLLSRDGKPITNFKIPTEVDRGIAAVKRNLRLAGHRLADESIKLKCSLAGIGIGSPGTIKYPEGIVTDSSPNIPGWVGTNVSRLFSEFEIPVKCDNDANCMGLAEAKFGAGKGTLSGFYLTIGTGIGGAVVIDGSLVRGATFAAGEFGHMVFKYDGKEYTTGRRGPIEAYVSAPALVRAARKAAAKSKSSRLRNYKPLNTVEIFREFKAGDMAATDVVRENAELLGIAIGSVVNLLNPEVVVIGGGVSAGGPRYIDLIKKSVKQFAFRSATAKLKIKTARFGNEAGWIGAACLNI